MRAVTRTLFAASTEPDPMGWPASAAAAYSMRRRLLRRKPGSRRTSSVPLPFGGRWRSAPVTLPTPLGSWGGTCRHLPDQAVPSAVSGPGPGSRGASPATDGATSPTNVRSGCSCFRSPARRGPGSAPSAPVPGRGIPVRAGPERPDAALRARAGRPMAAAGNARPSPLIRNDPPAAPVARDAR